MNNTTAYQYYKVVIDDIQSTTDNIQQMGEFTMLTKNAAPDLAHSTPLTFEAKADGFTVTLTSNMDPLPSLEYSIDGGAWTDFTFSGDIATTDPVNIGHTISFRGNNTRFFYSDYDSHISNFSCSQDCYLYGNMMSLLSAESYAMNTSVGESAFYRLFYGNTNIYSHDTKQLALPATTLARSCYESLFSGCTHLTTAPNLPATTLATTCYYNMFSGCAGLVNAPEISATTLAYFCCASMFSGCTSLTTGPTLYATTLDDCCYDNMFKNCSNLNSVTCLATNISAEGCTESWLDGVAATGTFTAANNTVAWSEGTSGIPSGWTRVNQYNIVNLASLTGDYEAQNNDVLTGTLDAENYPVKISIAAGATVTLNGATINGTHNPSSYKWAGITCLGDATIILSGTNTVKGFNEDYPGVYVPEGYTLTIQGTGSLTASSNGWGAGIGGGYNISCGNIVINGGNIVVTGGSYAAGIGGDYKGSCGNITISGGSITANGGVSGAGIGTGREGNCGSITISGGSITANGGGSGAGIGTGYQGNCGSITIYNTVTSVTATKGLGAPNSIGAGESGTCGTVTIGGTEYYNGSAYQNDGATYLATSPLVYPAPATGHALASAVVGEIVGTDGLAYDVADKDNLPTGVTAVAMVAYKDGSNGLAIQLNASPSSMDFDNAQSYTGYPAVSGGVATWRLPSKDDWQNMFVGCAKSGDADKDNWMDPIAGFKEKIAATGIAFESNGYWSPSGTYSWAVDINLYDTYATASFSSTPGYYYKYVLGCLAF